MSIETMMVEGRDRQFVPFVGTPEPGLVAFRFMYTDDEDHHAGHIGVEDRRPVGDNGLLLWFNDQDGSDNANIRVRYLDLADFGPRRSVRGTTRGSSAVTITPPLSANQLFVLSSFYFKTIGSNHHLSGLKIEPHSSGRFIEISYGDDDGEDEYEYAIEFMVVPHSDAGDSRSPRFLGPFRSPTLNFDGDGTAVRETGCALLQGFSFEFSNGSHPIQAVFVDLAPPGSEQTGISVCFRDQNGDDPVTATVSYIVAMP